MIRTIGRYGARHVRGSMSAALKAILHGDGLRGPSIAEFEKRFADYHGMHHAISASYGRMAFYYILKSLNLPRDSEIIFPALTFWVVPEMARVLGFRPKFVDIDPETFNIDPVKMEAAITPNTRVVVPTHLYGQPCEMEPITAAARTHGVFVIEDCAHALGEGPNRHPALQCNHEKNHHWPRNSGCRHCYPRCLASPVGRRQPIPGHGSSAARTATRQECPARQDDSGNSAAAFSSRGSCHC